jgi:hypothetical protein
MVFCLGDSLSDTATGADVTKKVCEAISGTDPLKI